MVNSITNVKECVVSRIISTLKLIGTLLLCLLILPVSFIVFTLWELVDRKGSNEFWDEVYDPYDI